MCLGCNLCVCMRVCVLHLISCMSGELDKGERHRGPTTPSFGRRTPIATVEEAVQVRAAITYNRFFFLFRLRTTKYVVVFSIYIQPSRIINAYFQVGYLFFVRPAAISLCAIVSNGVFFNLYEVCFTVYCYLFV